MQTVTHDSNVAMSLSITRSTKFRKTLTFLPQSAEVLLSIADPTISGNSGAHHSSLVRAARSVYETHSRRKRDRSDLMEPHRYIHYLKSK